MGQEGYLNNVCDDKSDGTLSGTMRGSVMMFVREFHLVTMTVYYQKQIIRITARSTKDNAEGCTNFIDKGGTCTVDFDDGKDVD